MRLRRSAALILLALGAACGERGPLAPVVTSHNEVAPTEAFPDVRFSEIHYDNVGTDANERIEISGPAGASLAGWSIVLYNGNGGAVYDTKNLSGTIPATCGTRGVVVQAYAVNGIQNGNPDGMALVNNGVVVEFLSYGGPMTGVGGPAGGLTSTDIGIVEVAAPVGQSLQRSGANVWSGPKADTFGACNDGTGTPPPAQVVASVVVSPATAAVSVNGSQTFTAAAFDAAAQPISGVVFTWSSSDIAVATIGATTGVASALSAGTTTITATAPNSVSGTASLTVNAVVPPPGTLPATRFSELHYDNVGTDANEALEIEGPAGTDLTGWSVVLYDGNGGASYNVAPLSGTILASCTGTSRGVVVVNYPSNGIQNGSPDGFALVNALGNVVEFLSYEGAFTAVGGPANGLLSTDIGVSETNSVVGTSLHRSSTGEWQPGATSDFGFCNGTPAPPPAGSIAFSGRNATADPPLPVGYQDQIFANVTDGLGQPVVTTITWTSETPSIASIDQNGVFTALAAGTAILRATTAQGLTATYSLPTRVALAGAAQYAGNAEFGEPADSDPNDDFIVRHVEFTTSYSKTRNTPNWVSYELESTHFGAEDRCDCFTFDVDLPGTFTRYTTANYTGAGAFHGYGIDRGHLARSFDRTSGSLDNAHSFLFTNIVPQAADQNQGPWAIMENFLGDLARLQNKEVYIIAGVAGNKGTIKNEGLIVIPEFTWKVAVVMPRNQGLVNIVDGTEPVVYAAIMPNVPGVRNVDWMTYLTTVDAVEALSGYNLLALLPDNIEAQLEKGNHFPVASTNGPYSGVEGTAITLSASTSTDVDVNDVLVYAWNFGDGTTGTGVSPSHVFQNNGVYNVTVTVTDLGGASTSATTTATVANVIPVVSLIPSGTTWQAGVSSSVGVAFTDANPRDAPFIIRYNWGDGTAINTLVSAIIPTAPLSRAHTYAAAGSYLLTVTVTDRDGGVRTLTLAIFVQP